MDFTAIDFETANGNLTSACSLGVTVVRNSIISETKHWLIRPVPYYFNYYNTKIHGIKKEDVELQRNFGELWTEIEPFLRTDFIVAHNASFDISVLKSLVEYYKIKLPNYAYLCTCILSRSIWPEFENHKLSTICSNLCIGLEHHNAASDSLACANVLIAVNDHLAKFGNLIELKTEFKYLDLDCVECETTCSDIRPRRRYESIRYSDLTPIVTPSNCNHPLCGKNIVFTGELTNLKRNEAIEIALRYGANVKGSVSKNTKYLVVGIQDKTLVGEDGMSGKEEKAYSLMENGIDIKIISEAEFLKLIG